MFQLIFRYADQWNNKFNHRVTDSGIEVSVEYSAIKFKIVKSKEKIWTRKWDDEQNLKKCIMQSNLVNLRKYSQ